MLLHGDADAVVVGTWHSKNSNADDDEKETVTFCCTNSVIYLNWETGMRTFQLIGNNARDELVFVTQGNRSQMRMQRNLG